MDLAGKYALVTGASRGIGRAIATRLANEGAFVFVNYRRSRSEAQEAVDKILAAGGAAEAVKADVGDVAEVRGMFEYVGAVTSSLDILVANAAFGVPGPIVDSEPKHWDVTMDASARSLLTLTQAALPLMNRGGHIISITSEGGQKVIPGYGLVGAAKAALEAITRTLAAELAPRNILVNGILAGLCDTKSLRAVPGAVDMIDEVLRKTPRGRLVTPDDIANVVSLLLSPKASMICGQFIVVDGGKSTIA